MLSKTMKRLQVKRQIFGKITRDLFRIVLALLVLMQPLASVWAQEIPDNVVATGVTGWDATTDPNSLIITANDGATIDWKTGFSIEAGKSVHFVVCESCSVLNTDTSGSASDIWGVIYSPGRVFLINVDGINFHESAGLGSATTLIASTLNLSKENFMAGNQTGNYEFEKVSGSDIGKIINEANLSGRQIAFIAEQIQNKGLIEANLGRVMLGAGSKQTLSFDGQGLINLVVDEGSADALITNETNGTIRANGGKVLLAAKDINNTLDHLVNNTGVIEATHMIEHDGIVEFVTDGAVEIKSNGGIQSTGTLRTDYLDENGASFYLAGISELGHSIIENADHAINYGTGSFSGSYSDAADIIINTNAVITLNGDTTFSAGNNFTMNSGSSIVQSGSRTLNLSIGSGYAGTLRSISVQNLALSGAGTYTENNSLSLAGTLDLSGGTTLDVGGQSVNITGLTTITDSIYTGSSGSSTFSGGLSMTGGTLSGSNSISLGGNVTTNASSTTSTISSSNLYLGSTTRTFTIADGAATDDLRISSYVSSGGITKTGNGKMVLSGTSSSLSATTVSAGILNLQHSSALSGSSVTVADGAALELQGGISLGLASLALNGTGISDGGALRNISGTNSISFYSSGISLGSATRISSDSGALAISGGSATNTISGAGQNLAIGGAGNVSISAGMSSAIGTTSGTLTKDGLGTLTLSGSSSYTGLTNINAGIVSISSSTALGTTALGTIVATGAALQVAGVSVGAETLTLNGDGISSSGALRSTTGGSWSGAITLGGAGVRINTDSGTMTLAGGITGSGLDLTVGGAGNTTISTTGVNTITGGTLTKDGTGTLALSAAGDYTGLTNIRQGLVTISNALALGAVGGSGTTVAADLGAAALQLSGGVTFSAEALTLNGDGISSGGALRNISGTNTWSNSILLGSATRINSDSGTTTTLSGGITGNGLGLTVGGVGTTTISGTGINTSTGGTLTKDGSGTLNLNVASDYKGLTTINAGVVAISNAGYLGAIDAGTIVSATGAALQISGGVDFGAEALTLYGTGISSGGALRSISGTNTWSSGIILGSASRINSDAGTLTLTGGITGDGLGLTIGGSGATTVSTIGINTDTNGVTNGTLTKDGVGTLTLNAASNYKGLTTISAGILAVSNALGLGTIDTGTTVTSGAEIRTLGDINVGAEALTLAGTGVSGNGAWRNTSGANFWSGVITLGNTSRINSDAGTITLTGGITGMGFALTIGGSGNTTVSTSGINTGTAGALTKTGTGTLTLNTDNNYTGTTSVSQGTLEITHASALGAVGGSGTTVSSGATLRLSNGIAVANEALTLSNTGVSNLGALRVSSGVNSWGGAITLASTSTIGVDNSGDSLELLGTVTSNAAGNFGLTKVGAGTLTVSNTVTLGTSGGTTSADLLVSAGTLNGTGSFTIYGGGATGNGIINLTGGTFLLDGAGNFGGNSNWTFNHLTLGDGSGVTTTTKTAGSTGNITVSNDFSIGANQIFSASDDTYTIGGNWTKNAAATFTAGTSTVNLSGINQTISGSNTFYILTKMDTTDDAASRTLTLASGTTQTITNALTLDGFDADDQLILNGAASFNLTGAATFTGDYLSIQDNTILDNSSALSLPFNPNFSTNLGGTTGWFSAVVQSGGSATALAALILSGNVEGQKALDSHFLGGNSNAPIFITKGLYEIRERYLTEAQKLEVSGSTIELV